MLTVKEAAARAKVSRQMIYRWTTVERRLPHIRAGARGRRGKVLIAETDLDAFLASLRVDAESGEVARPIAPRRLRHLTLE